MSAISDIGQLNESSPDIRGGRPCVAGTGVTVHGIVIWYMLGLSPEEIAERIGHLDLSQVHAALTYYYANQSQIEAEIAAADTEADRVYQEHHAKRTSP